MASTKRLGLTAMFNSLLRTMTESPEQRENRLREKNFRDARARYVELHKNDPKPARPRQEV